MPIADRRVATGRNREAELDRGRFDSEIVEHVADGIAALSRKRVVNAVVDDDELDAADLGQVGGTRRD